MKDNQVSIFNLILFPLFIVTKVNCHPAPSLKLCHGIQQNILYYYDYSTLITLNNIDHDGKEPVGFQFQSTYIVQNVYEDKSNFLIKIELEPKSKGNFLDRKGAIRSKPDRSSSGSKYPLYVWYKEDDINQDLNSFFVHTSSSVTDANLKKAIAVLIRSKPSSQSNGVVWTKNGQKIVQQYSNLHDNNSKMQSLMVSKTTNEWSSVSQLARDHSYITESHGWQNVSLKSRLYKEAYSKLSLTYNLKLIKEENAKKSSLASSSSIEQVIEALGNDYVEEKPSLKPEKHSCHDCKSLESFVKEYEEHMHANEMASIPATIAYLKLLERIRSGGPGLTHSDIMSILNSRARDKDVLASLLDILSASKNEAAISASFDFLNLPQNEDLDIAERFLTTLSGSSLTFAQSSESSDSYLEFIHKELLKIVKTPKWKSDKLKWSTLLTLATVLQAYNNIKKETNLIEDKLNQDTYNVLESELNSCMESDCQVALLHAFGCGANLQLGFNALESFALNPKAKKESVTALKSIVAGLKFLFEKCNQIDKDVYTCIKGFLTEKLTKQLRKLAAQIIWESKQETTSRILATEIVVTYLNDGITTFSLLKDIQNFDNFEMTTMMWSKALKNKKLVHDTTPVFTNWFVHSKTLNGTSAHFTNVLAGTQTMNFSYGLTLEMLKRGNLLKESSFDFEIADEGSKPQHVLSVSLLARGLESFTGDDNGSEAEPTSAEMAIKILGVQIRPYTLFSGKGELLGHVWSGTASEPITAFAGNFILSDINNYINLINGFVIEERHRGVLSIKITGQTQISLWNRNSNSLVITQASLIIQGSQTIHTSDQSPTVSQQFAFGGSTSINLITDADFYKSPFKHCLQMQQPELIFRHNTRKYEQFDFEKVDRRIHRRNYFIPPKSFAFHNYNNKMCAILKTN